MNHKMLIKFVVDGMKKSKKTLVPFLIAGSITVMIFYILYSMAYSPYIYYDGKEAFYGAQTIVILLEMGGQIVGIFGIIFLLYANQFVMKNRRKEIGLYGILGLSQKHIMYIMFIEILIKGVICIGAGIVVGTFLNKLMLLTLYKIINQPIVSGMLFSVEALQKTFIYFVLIFGVCLISNIRSVNVSNPIELLRSDKTGEKEPQVKWLMLTIGVITLIGGYYIALASDSAADALNGMMQSILLVICGTYCLFIAGSIFILKVLKKNRKFYYKTRNFISVSNLIYRMKHNAAGLASICVLSTGVILLMTCVSSLMILGEQNINRIFPSDVKIEASNNQELGKDYYVDAIEDAADAVNVNLHNPNYYKYRNVHWTKTEYGFQTAANTTLNKETTVNVYIMSLEEYNAHVDRKKTLRANEILVYSSAGEDREKVHILGESFHISGSVEYDKVSAITDYTMSLFQSYIVVFDNEDTIKKVVERDENISEKDMFQIYIGFDTKQILTETQLEEFQVQLQATIGAIPYEVSFKQIERAFLYNMYGGAFFVGSFLAVLFLMATVMIIYYKQMSEGIEDQKRYQILSYVGLTDAEIKATIKRQVMILFFLPVITAIIHMTVASRILRLFLRIVLIVDPVVFGVVMLVVSFVFVLVYAVVYKITSRQYYKIVKIH